MIEVHTPCRLHFGLLAYSHDESRQFGGAGLMVDDPDITLRAELDDGFSATGPMAERALTFAKRFIENALATNLVDRFEAADLEIIDAPRAHSGLGTGTQLAMAVGQAMAHLIGQKNLSAGQIARLVERGERSAIGVHGFEHGGLIVEGGKLDPTELSPLLLRQAFPDDWRLVLITPDALSGVSGQLERQAFSKLPPISSARTAEMCRLVLLGLLPALIDRDIDDFGQALYQLQTEVGQCFKKEQGGVYADPLLERMVSFIRDQGVTGVGQSSWGPTLYAVTSDQSSATSLLTDLRQRFDLGPREIRITAANNTGHAVRQLSAISENQS